MPGQRILIMDFADILEELRKTLRGLCVGPVRLSTDAAYGDDIADPSRLVSLSSGLRQRLPTLEEDAGAAAASAAAELDRIAALIEKGPVKPSMENLCERYGGGLLDARTVIYLTGWGLERLYDECEKVTGKPAPPAY